MTLKAVARDLLPPVVTRAIKRALKSAGSMPKAPADDLMMWMGFVNPGMLYSGNIDLFAYCIDYRNHLIETFRRNVVLFEAGGFIVFDDSGDDGVWEGQSHRTAREAAGLARYELIAKNPNYCIRRKA